VRSDAERGRALGNVRGDQRADWIAPDAKANLLELAREVLQRVLVHIGVGVAANRLVGFGEVGAGQRLDVVLDALRRAVSVDRERLGH
jgi:hypothetical protein